MTLSLVTGGSGFIGRHLVDQLILKGSKVRILDPGPPASRHAGIDHIQGSVTDRRLVGEAMQGVDYVYHTAALSDLWIAEPALYEEINVGGTRIVCEAACAAGIKRMVHTSSATVLIDDRVGMEPQILDEGYHSRERGLIGKYARSKWRAERLALSFQDRLSLVVVLPTLPLGPGDHRLTPPGRMLLNFMNGTNRAYVDCILNIIDVRDAAAGHYLACMNGRSGRRYLLNGHSLPMAAFLACLETVTGRKMPGRRLPGGVALAVSALLEAWSHLVSGKPPLAPLAGTRLSQRPVSFDGNLAKSELILPERPLADTLIDAIAWLRDEGHLPDENASQPGLSAGG